MTDKRCYQFHFIKLENNIFYISFAEATIIQEKVRKRINFSS